MAVEIKASSSVSPLPIKTGFAKACTTLWSDIAKSAIGIGCNATEAVMRADIVMLNFARRFGPDAQKTPVGTITMEVWRAIYGVCEGVTVEVVDEHEGTKTGKVIAFYPADNVRQALDEVAVRLDGSDPEHDADVFLISACRVVVDPPLKVEW